jgi:hypothetical protein
VRHGSSQRRNDFTVRGIIYATLLEPRLQFIKEKPELLQNERKKEAKRTPPMKYIA